MPSWSTDACPSGAFSVVQRSFGWQFLWRNWWCFPLGFGGTLFQTIWDDDEATSRTLLLKTLLLWLLDICFCGLIPLKPVFFALAARAVGYRQLNHLTFSLLVNIPGFVGAWSCISHRAIILPAAWVVVACLYKYIWGAWNHNYNDHESWITFLYEYLFQINGTSILKPVPSISALS